ncbi:hypothetical protein PV721_33510 [Streptomyces sp. MB09-01]|uniref:hypothetical protein n=1 Tax=Streptomyces sp. MB09-01 TaxID=3028666 RepID=UPI0029A78F18|nr:hypothetical protein [Streptomyces sp. MB09-01]MDX3539156.1 hypothetical protein [Streptomyces sp. MB09-01]
MNPEHDSPRVRTDLRVQDTRVVHTGAGGSVVDKFGAQPGAPLKDVRHIPESARRPGP